MREVVASLLVLGGALFTITAAIGAVRLPDVLCRLHAVAKALTLGMFLLLLGIWVYLYEAGSGAKILLAIVFQTLTIPVASHLVALLAFQKQIPRWRARPMDDHRETKST